MKKFYTLLVLVFYIHTNAQIITTVVGNGINGYSGNGGQATNAEISYPWTGTFDAAGNMYYIDLGYYVVRKINTLGIITTIAGNGYTGYTGDGGQATAASFHEPIAIAINAVGNIYISDDQNNVIRMINTAGIITTIAGTGVAGFSGDGGQATAAELNSQNGIAFDALGNLYIADGSNNRIRKVNTAGVITTIAGTGTSGFSGDGGEATSAEINNPSPVAFDALGNLYFADGTNHIRMINTAGIITTFAGTGVQGFNGDGGQATAAAFNFPNGIALDAVGNLYIADFQNNRIRKVNTVGIIITIAGTGIDGYNGDGGQANAAEINFPGGLFLDNGGNLFIADQKNFRIRKVTNVIPDTNQAGIFSLINTTSNCNDTIITLMATLENYGTNLLTSCVINYQVDAGAIQTYTWSGSLTSGQTTLINFPSFISTVGSHTAVCYTSNPNNASISTFEIVQSSINFSIAFGTTLPVMEGFETSTCPSGVLPNPNWSISHTTTGGTDFQITSTAAATGSMSCMLNNMNNIAGNNSILETNFSYDMTTIATPLLTFQAAYQQKATTNADKLQIFTSTDCGNSWQSRKVITSTTLASLAGGTGTNAYVPIPSQFTTYTVPINAVSTSHNVMFRWEFLTDTTGGVGNNLYIDNINIIPAADAGIEQFTTTNEQITIYPNPNNGSFVIEPNNSTKQTMQVYDVNGKLVLSQTISGKTSIYASGLNEGVYNISLQSNEGVVNKRLVIVR